MERAPQKGSEPDGSDIKDQGIYCYVTLIAGRRRPTRSRSSCAIGCAWRAGRLRVKGYSWTGEESVLEAEYLAEKPNGFYISAGTEDELIAAFEKTLDCPMLSGHIGR